MPLLKPRLLDNVDDQGNHVNDDSVKDRDKTDFHSGQEKGGSDEVEDTGDVFQIDRYFFKCREHLEESEQLRKDAEHHCEGTDFLDPAGCFPGGEENSDKEDRENRHKEGDASNKQFEHSIWDLGVHI